MSKTLEEVGLVAGGIAAIVLGVVGYYGFLPFGISAIQLSAVAGLGATAALSGVGLALRQNPKPVGISGSVSVQTGSTPRRVIYGQFQTAGVLTYASFPPSQDLNVDEQYVHLVYTIAAHEISSFDAVVINGTIYNFGSDVIWTSGAYPGYYWNLWPLGYASANDFYYQHILFEFDFGRNSPAQPFPQLAAADSSWTSACVQQGCAKVHVVLRADQGWPALFPSGQIPNFQFLITGKKILDPRIVTAWQASTGYLKYQWFEDTRGIVWVQTNTSGTSSASRPNFEGAGTSWPVTVADNTLSWTTYGNSVTTIEAGSDGSPQGHVVLDRLVNDAWDPGATFPIGYIIEAPLGYYQEQTGGSGTTGASEPAFSTTLGGTTTDNTQAWVCLGRSRHAINPSNSALVVADYLQDTLAGLGAAPATIDFSSVIAAANICEDQALIIWNPDNSVVYENFYSTNGAFDYSSTRGNVLTSLCAAMAGWVVPPGDLWHVFAGSYVTPTTILTDADMRGAIKGDFRLSKRDVANSIKGKYVPAYLPSNPSAQLSLTQVPGTWQAQSFPAYQANGLNGKPNYLNSEDGGQVIWQDIQLDFCTSLWQAQRLAKITLMRLRFQQTLTLPAKLTAFAIEAGDVFQFSHPRWGFISGNFQADQVSVVFDDTGAKDSSPIVGIDIVARQIDPSIYYFQQPTSASDYGEYSSFGTTGVMSGTE